MRFFLIFLCLLFIGSSCTTSFQISVREPKEVKVPSTALRFGVVNNVTDIKSAGKTARVILGSEIIKNGPAADRAVEGFIQSIENSNNLTATAFISDSIDFGGGPRWEYIDSIAEINNFQGIIQFVEMNNQYPIGGAVGSAISRNGSPELKGELIFNIYIANTHEIFENLSVKGSLIVSRSSTNIIEAIDNIGYKKECYIRLGFELGQSAGRLIYPNWIWVNRTFYTSGSKSLKKASPNIYAGNWTVAETILLKDRNHIKDKTRGRVLYDLAIIEEGKGNIVAAIEYVNLSLECGEVLADRYLIKLNERLKINEELNE